MTYVQGSVVELPRMEPRPWGRFIDVVPDFKAVVDGVDRAPRGVRFMAPGDLTPIVVDAGACAVDDNKSVGNLGLTETPTASFLAFNLLTCSTLSGELDSLSSYVDDAFRGTVSEALAYAATGAIDANHLNLAVNSTNLGGSTTLIEVIGTIEMGLGQRISNQRGYIFIPLRYLAAAVSTGIVKIFGDQLVSPAGHLVISDAGHRPYNVVYGTGALAYNLSDDMPLDSFNYARNQVTWLKETYGTIIFNPAWSVRSTLTGGYPG